MSELPENWYLYHHKDCGAKYRGCHPTLCPKNVYETTGKWIGSSGVKDNVVSDKKQTVLAYPHFESDSFVNEDGSIDYSPIYTDNYVVTKYKVVGLYQKPVIFTLHDLLEMGYSITDRYRDDVLLLVLNNKEENKDPDFDLVKELMEQDDMV